MACRFCDYEKMKEAIVYSDENVYAALSNAPLSYGHILVVPRRHIERLEELSVDEIATLFCVVKNLLPKLLKAVNASDYNLFINAGPRANQNVFHLHIHIIPRGAQGSRLDVFFSAFNSEKSYRLSKNALAKTTGLIRKQISQVGIEEQL
jgi:histidine triad (HIT) family protein